MWVGVRRRHVCKYSTSPKFLFKSTDKGDVSFSTAPLFFLCSCALTEKDALFPIMQPKENSLLLLQVSKQSLYGVLDRAIRLCGNTLRDRVVSFILSGNVAGLAPVLCSFSLILNASLSLCNPAALFPFPPPVAQLVKTPAHSHTANSVASCHS